MKIETRRLAQDDFNIELFIIILAGLVLGFFIIVPKDFYSLFPCVFKRLTGIPCPTCGITRTALYLFQGNLASAWHTSFFYSILFAAGAAFAAYSGITLFFKGRRIRLKPSNPREFYIWVGIAGVLFIVNWALAMARGI